MTEDARRKHSRHNVHWSCRLLLPNKAIVAARVKNISLGGAGLEVPHVLPEGQQLSIEMRPMHSGRSYLVRARGQVTFSMIKGGDGGFSVGMRFTLIPEEHKKELATLISKLSSEK